MGARALACFALLTGCYLSHQPTDAGAPGCAGDLDCDDSDRCTLDRCEASRCVHAPRPFELIGTVPAGGSVWGSTTHAGEAVVAAAGSGSVTVRRFGADGDRGALVEFDVEGDRAWDTSLASTGDDLAIVTHEAGQLALRMASSPERVDRVMGGLFVVLAYTGRELLAVSDFPGCEVAWATSDGRWIEGSRQGVEGCDHTQVLSTGHPTWRRPVRVSAGQAILWSLTGDGGLNEARLMPGDPIIERLTLDEPGPRFFHSLVALDHEGRTAGLWVRTDDDVRRDVHFGLLAREGERVVPSEVDVIESDDAPYAIRMSIAHCAGRFVGIHADEARVWVRQIDGEGREVAEPFTVSDGLPSAGSRTVACFDGGAIVTTWTEIHMLACR